MHWARILAVCAAAALAVTAGCGKDAAPASGGNQAGPAADSAVVVSVAGAGTATVQVAVGTARQAPVTARLPWRTTVHAKPGQPVWVMATSTGDSPVTCKITVSGKDKIDTGKDGTKLSVCSGSAPA
jgi:hypothetical protein